MARPEIGMSVTVAATGEHGIITRVSFGGKYAWVDTAERAGLFRVADLVLHPEHGPSPMRCEGDGCFYGEVEIRVCSHSGCCPCAGKIVACEECDGTGLARCSACGERAAVLFVDYDRMCLMCGDERAAEMAEEETAAAEI